LQEIYLREGSLGTQTAVRLICAARRHGMHAPAYSAALLPGYDSIFQFTGLEGAATLTNIAARRSSNERMSRHALGLDPRVGSGSPTRDAPQGCCQIKVVSETTDLQLIEAWCRKQDSNL
jgi:hypothetical protein